MRSALSLVALMILLLVAPARLLAAPITYLVTIDTSSISGISGSLDFNFDPGFLVTQPASLQILNFTSNGTLAGACPCGTGDVSGQLPGTLTFDNGAGFNDYFEDFTFGTTLSFDASFYGAALSTPGGTTSGSVFAFSMFSDAAGTVPVLTSDAADGFAVTIGVNLDGTTTVDDLSTQASVKPLSATAVTPEPSCLALFLTGLVALVCLHIRRQWIGLAKIF